MSLGSVIVLWREERGLSQAELARRSGLSRAQLSAIEFGRRDTTVGTLRRIAATLGVSPGSLVDGSVPGAGETLTRAVMERIAREVAAGGEAPSQHPALIALLLALTRSRRAARNPRARSARGPRTGRPTALAFTALKNALGKEQIDSLLQRIDEHVDRHAAG
jgi:transcriptional regulator with XRE-family HTH domain